MDSSLCEHLLARAHKRAQESPFATHNHKADTRTSGCATRRGQRCEFRELLLQLLAVEAVVAKVHSKLERSQRFERNAHLLGAVAARRFIGHVAREDGETGRGDLLVETELVDRPGHRIEHALPVKRTT